MTDESRENLSDDSQDLKELFETFLTAEEAAKAIEDVNKGEQILRLYPAPEPTKELLDNIKSEIAFNLLNRNAHVFRNAAYRVAAIAAVALIVAAIGLNLLKKDKRAEKPEYTTASIMPRALWESDDIAADDANLAMFTTEVEQIEDELTALQLGKSNGNGEQAVAELEIKLIEIESDFWKG
jgi:anti-sigma-K factor RskA